MATFAFLSCLHSALAQPAPALVFKNPVLQEGVAGADGAVYRFGNVAAGTDGLLKIVKRSHAAVLLEDIDVADAGWAEALQPRLGMGGSIAANQSWWMQFELTFVQHGGMRKKPLNRFAATPIDVDGDNVGIREFLQLDAADDVAYAARTCLNTEAAPFDKPSGAASHTLVGPLSSFEGIDTAATAVMATYTYENKEVLTFVVGATSSGAIVGGGGMVGLRLASVWFKPFDLKAQAALPGTLESFAATCGRKAVRLHWQMAGEKHTGRFVVERSVNGRTYMSIASITAQGGKQGFYTYKDKERVMMPAGVVYYRLRLVEANGSVSYSPVSTVFAEEKEDRNVMALFAGTSGR